MTGHSSTDNQPVDSLVPRSPLARRKWFRFSLRSLLVAAALICLLAAWQGNRYRNQRNLQKLITAAELNGYSVRTADFVFGRPLPTDEFWQRLLSPLAEQDVSRVDLVGAIGKDPEETYAVASRARRLDILLMQDYLDRAKISRCLGNNTTYLLIGGTNLTADALEDLPRFSQLQWIHISDDVVQLPSLLAVGEHRSLISISLRAKAEDLQRLRELRCRLLLREIFIRAVPNEFRWDRDLLQDFVDSPLSGIEDLRFLEGCENLQTLVVENPVKDEVVTWIAVQFPNLQYLALSNSQLSDEAVELLLRLPNLKRVTLFDCQLTAAASYAIDKFHIRADARSD